MTNKCVCNDKDSIHHPNCPAGGTGSASEFSGLLCGKIMNGQILLVAGTTVYVRDVPVVLADDVLVIGDLKALGLEKEKLIGAGL